MSPVQGNATTHLESGLSGEEGGEHVCLLSRETPPLTLKVASLDRREENMCVSSLVDTPTALGMILAVFSFVIAITEVMGIWICENKNQKIMAGVVEAIFQWCIYCKV